jgi:alanine dehydrogenase
VSEIVVLSGSDVLAAVGFSRCVEAVTVAFAAHQQGDSRAFPVVREKLPEGGIFGVKSGYLATEGLVGLKAGGFWAGNPMRGLSAHQSAMLLFDSTTGRLRAVLDANVITILRTAAAGALAAKYLAPSNARTAAVIGSGAQAVAQTRALAWAVPTLSSVTVHARSAESFERYAKEVEPLGLATTRSKSIREAVAQADVVVTATPSWEPLVEAAWLKSVVHVSAIGADTRGKQELHTDLFRDAMIVVDDWEQARTIGECQHATAEGIIDSGDIHAELGALVVGEKSGRVPETGRSIFDSTGIALQDLATAAAAVSVALREDLGIRANLANVGPESVWSS